MLLPEHGRAAELAAVLSKSQRPCVDAPQPRSALRTPYAACGTGRLP
jgi:hypothetical protein